MTNLGKFVFGLLIIGLISVGSMVVIKRHHLAAVPPAGVSTTDSPAQAAGVNPALAKDLAEALQFPAALPGSAPYVMKDNTIEIELAKWPGYAGLVAYNGGLDVNTTSLFTTTTGYKLKLSVNEDEDWGRLVTGKLAGSSTTADVLSVYGKQLNVIAPVQIDFSRGADAIVVRNDINKINDLKGKIVSCCQFTESDFLLRDLAHEAGLEVNLMTDLSAAPDPEKINMVVTDEGLKAGDIFLKDLSTGGTTLAGCVTWSPKTEEVIASSQGKARILTTNRNLLIVADLLILNKPFAQANPKVVDALTRAVIDGNKMVSADPQKYAPVVEKALGFKPGEFVQQFKQVHLSNLPENLAFFNGTIDSAGSFPGIYESAVLSYGTGIVRTDTPSEFFMDTSHLKALDATGDYKDERVEIAPIKIGSTGESLEQNPLLSKNIRFYFKPNSSDLDPASEQNVHNFDDIKNLLKLSPGSTVLLRGHVDDGLVFKLRQQGGEALVQQMALKAMQLSKDRAEAVRKELLKQGVPEERLSSVGRGWEEPVSKSSPDDTSDVQNAKGEKNRRVEAVWLTIE